MKSKKPVKAKPRIVKEKGPLNQCMRCQKKFTSRKALKLHSKAHLQALHELKMLEKGLIPDETKLGAGFRGKNRIIVT